MKKIIYTLLALFISSPFISNATDLVYKWKPGIIYRFQATVLDDISTNMSMMGVNSNNKETYKTETTFALKVKSVLPNGAADGILYVEQFKVSNTSGKVLASMASLPKEALNSPVQVDKKGNFTFKKIVYMIIQEGGSNMVVSGKAEKNKVSATTTGPDGTQLSVHAEFDPKTGTLKTGYSAATVGTPKQKKVMVKEDAPKVDIIPYAFIELLKLPDGDAKPGQTISVNMTGADMKFKMESLIASIATFNCDFASNTKDMTTPSNTTKIEGSDNTGMKMDMNIGGMENMEGMGNMGGMDMNTNGMTQEEQAMVPENKTKGNIISTFDTANGVFKTCKGTVTTTSKSSGINMNVVSTLSMKGLN
jgi:hypothetical protein